MEIEEHKKSKEIYLPINVFILANDSNLSSKKFMPDCLIKILGKPIIFYNLEFLERNHIKEAIILTTHDYSSEISTTLTRFNGNIKATIIALTSDQFSDLKIFQYIKRKISEQSFILINSDSIFDFNLVEMFSNHLLNSNLLTLCFGKQEEQKKLNYYENEIEYTPISQAFGVISNKNSGDLEEELKQIVYCTNINEKGKYVIPVDILEKFDKFDLDHFLCNSEFYIFKKSIFEIFSHKKVKEMNNIKSQFIPFLINKQEHRLIKKIFPDIKIYANIVKNGVFKLDSHSKILSLLSEIQKTKIDEIPLVLFPTRNNDENIFIDYKDKINENIKNNKNPNFELEGFVKIISIDSYVCKPFIISGAKSSVIKSYIGKNCNVGENSKISNSYVMDNVIIGKK